MTSNVSIVSDIVANGHQIIPNDSCSPSKIPYGGFSPVRLQTRVQPRPSSARPELKRMTRVPSNQTGLYTAKVQVSPPMASEALCPPRQVNGGTDHGPSRPEALGSPLSYVVSLDHRLLWPHPKLSVPPASLSASSRQVFAPRSGGSRSQEAPQFTPRVSLPVPSSVPRESDGTCRLFPSPPALAFTFSAQARHLPMSTRRFSWVVCDFGAATFALCCGPVSCLLFTGKNFYFRAFTSWGHPQGVSSITIRPKQSNCRIQTFTG
jgi:hypothetical protein